MKELSVIRDPEGDLSRRGEHAVAALSLPGILFLSAAGQVLALLFSARVSLFPGAEALMAVITTCSQIIAGLYGITMAGYTFFLSRMDALMASDVTLDYVVGCLKNRFKYLIWYITANVLMTLFVSIVLMYCPVPEGEELGFLYRLCCNEFVLFVAFSIVLILYYSVLVIDPNCLEKEARKRKRKLSRGPEKGSTVAFLASYDRICRLCRGMLPEPVLERLRESKGNRLELVMDLLWEQRPGLRPVLAEIGRIHRYYECTVNCGSITVTKEMCDRAAAAARYLEGQ